MGTYPYSWKRSLTGEGSIVLILTPSEEAAFLSWTPLVQNLRAERPLGGGGSAGAKSGILVPRGGSSHLPFPPAPLPSVPMERYEGQLMFLTVGLH